MIVLSALLAAFVVVATDPELAADVGVSAYEEASAAVDEAVGSGLDDATTISAEASDDSVSIVDLSSVARLFVFELALIVLSSMCVAV